MPFFSIIVSACNIAPYAAEMIRSIRTQSYVGYEVIVCYEASGDDTRAEIEKAIDGDERFQVIELSCSGSASAGRNYGMEHARGEYIVFLDGDDCLKELALEKLHQAYEKFGAVDLIGGNAETLWELDGECPVDQAMHGHPIASGVVMDAGEAMARIMRNGFQPAVWYQIYRLELLRGHPELRQREKRRHQDEEWTPRVFLAAKNFVKIEDEIYVYRKRRNSVTTKTNPQSLLDITDNLINFLEYWRTHEIPQCVKREYADWHADLFLRYFLPNSRRKFNLELRRTEFCRLTGLAENFRAFQEVVRLSSISKRILLPLFYLARFRTLFSICDYLFIKVYYPVVYVLWPRVSKGKCR